MKRPVPALKFALFLLLIATDHLVLAAENDDLVFDQDGKQSGIEIPLIERHEEQSFFHRVKRGFWDLFSSATTTTTTTTTAATPTTQSTSSNESDVEYIDLKSENSENFLSKVSSDDDRLARSRQARDSGEEIDLPNEHVLGLGGGSRRVPSRYGSSDDEDLAGSGEIEGSATESDLDSHTVTDTPKIGGKARFYRITLTVTEPYRREFADRKSREYKELSGNLTHAIEDLFNRQIPDYNHFANVVKISPTSDAFASQVTLDIGSTFTDEYEVRGIIEQQLQYHSLGGIQVGPEGFSFRIFPGHGEGELECDQSTELRCRNGACVPLESRCDGVEQCDDGSDETDCPKVYGHPQRPSEHGGPVPLEPVEPSGVDDDEDDDGNDRTTLRPQNKCRADDTVRCSDGSRYICSVQQCDGQPDCDDGADEVGCPHPGCRSGEFACDVSRCILDSQRCDYVEDCHDGSDEYDCNYPACSPNEFKCKNAECIDSSKHCDGVPDCRDSSDEHNCPCRKDQFECSPGYCLAISQRCDGVRDCNNGADEQNCYNMTLCRRDQFQCASGTCVSINARCDGRHDCPDYSDERNCNVTTCSGDQFRCLDGICLSIDKRCNGFQDCRNGEDEHQCGCGDAEFRCTDGRCIGHELQCNGENECSDGSDEKDCDESRNSYEERRLRAIERKMAAYRVRKLLAYKERQKAALKLASNGTFDGRVTLGIYDAFPELRGRTRVSTTIAAATTTQWPAHRHAEADKNELSAKDEWEYVNATDGFGKADQRNRSDHRSALDPSSKEDAYGYETHKTEKSGEDSSGRSVAPVSTTPAPVARGTILYKILFKPTVRPDVRPNVPSERLLYESNPGAKIGNRSEVAVLTEIESFPGKANCGKKCYIVCMEDTEGENGTSGSREGNGTKLSADSRLTDSRKREGGGWTGREQVAGPSTPKYNVSLTAVTFKSPNGTSNSAKIWIQPRRSEQSTESDGLTTTKRRKNGKNGNGNGKNGRNGNGKNGNDKNEKNKNGNSKNEKKNGNGGNEKTKNGNGGNEKTKNGNGKNANGQNGNGRNRKNGNGNNGNGRKENGKKPKVAPRGDQPIVGDVTDSFSEESLTSGRTDPTPERSTAYLVGRTSDLAAANTKSTTRCIRTRTRGTTSFLQWLRGSESSEESDDCLDDTSDSEESVEASTTPISATEQTSQSATDSWSRTTLLRREVDDYDVTATTEDYYTEGTDSAVDGISYDPLSNTIDEAEGSGESSTEDYDLDDVVDEFEEDYYDHLLESIDGWPGVTTKRCNDTEYFCDGRCIYGLRICDGHKDCKDGSDEINCEECPDGQLPCDNGACINKNFFCDKNRDCHDGSDERDCPDTGATDAPFPEECTEKEFTCNDGSCIPDSRVCDGRADCPQDEDELHCRRGCSRDQFQCRNGDCIRTDQWCNGYIDCDDGSDEDCAETTTKEPSHPVPGRCPAGQFMCVRDKACVLQSSICNGIPECRDGSDEENCGPTGDGSGLNLKTYPSEQVIKQSREVVFQCRDEGPLRARVRWLRGNNLPLPPGSRDLNGRLEMPNIQLEHSGTYICEAVGYPTSTPGRQLTVHLSVEKFEPPATKSPQVCQYDQATCSNGDCIPKTSVCDGKFDCTDGSDEVRCSPHGCEPNEFRCANKQCVSKLWRCDGDKDCADGTDEEECAPSPPGSHCSYSEFACVRDNQCIPKSYHCDMQRDCQDGSDELGCSPVYIVKNPPPMVVLEPGDLLTLTCTAIGVPIPQINWRRNWGHVPEKCSSTSINGTGTLTCPDIQEEDQGAYSCEALNIAGFVFAVPDAILIVKPSTVCPKGTFNAEARSAEECISCFCFGVATECRSANLFTYQIPPPFDRHKIVSVETLPTIKVHGDITGQISEVRSIGRDGVQLIESFSNNLDHFNVPYFALPENYHGSQLKSYGGYLKYTVRYRGNGRPNIAPSVILTGNNYVLVHKGKQLVSEYETDESVRFFYGDWYKHQHGSADILASREDIMMTLANVDNILIKAQYDDGPMLDVRITNIVMDTADTRNTGLGSASYVEECQCPTGYSGFSCEHCAPGYLRRESGPWLGQCYRDEPPCPPGYYGDPSRNIPCQICPCPLTNPSNQFARTCHLGSDGQPTCDCPPGYVGRRCEQCAAGYQGNPLIRGDKCIPVQQCDPDGSISPNADPQTGKCRCKQYATGLTCNQCKANTFNLASTNQFGCISCFCMGITNKCVSSNWYRDEVRISFTNSIRGFSLIESNSTGAPSITNGIRLNAVSREIVYNEFPNRGNNDVYYWQLPNMFLGDQVTAYGGNLKYTVRYVPSPGGQSSKNNAADVELISANDINLLYYSRETPEPNSQQSFTVPLLEQFWQRTDGTKADREHLLMALADVHAIRIKATYTTYADEVALSLVSLDTAAKQNTGRSRAVEVEECSCPQGYRGLSCEDCDVGYTRAIEGLYLGICEPCNCNGHSGNCDPETGICENCAHHTTGDYCEMCETGYEGDATRGTPNDCVGRNTGGTEDCNCNRAGSRGNSCINGRCECKRNVEGAECNRCRPATFGLSEENMDGCNECYCSGVSDNCHESSLFIQQIPMLVYDSRHGFTLTDSLRQDVIDDGFELNVAMNEIGYRFPDNRSRRLFWSLPAIFTGNKVKSYGGNLTLTQHIIAHPGAYSYKDQDILLIGNGITLFWTNPITIKPDFPLTYSVLLRETEWKRLTMGGPRSASRTDIMTVLSNLEAILVRASHSERMTATYISDISMDTAVENPTGSRRATQIEACRCPTGYIGTSCESCARGYYRDTSDRSVSLLGSCNLCPCNQNEESCEISRSGHVQCHCLPGYTGQYCQEIVDDPVTPTPIPPTLSPPRIVVYIQEPEFQIVHTGNTVRYHCSGRSLDNDSVHIKWEKEGGYLPAERSVDDSHGLLVIRDVKVTDSGIYVCQVSDGVNIGLKKVTLTVGGVNPVEPRASISPSYLEVQEGDPVEFRCEATGNPPPQTDWMRVHGQMSPEATFYNGVWRLPAASKSDAAEYKCIARNNVGTDERTTILYVRDNPHRPPPEGKPPVITPHEWMGTTGDEVRLVCTPSQRTNVTWTRSGGLPLPYSASQRDGVLIIMNPTPQDSGIYVCTAVSFRETVTSAQAKITIVPRRNPPSVKVKPDRQVVSQGTTAEVRCVTESGDTSGLQVKWSKYTETMSPNAQQIGDTLRIVNAQVSDRGVYICRVTGPSGSHEASAIIEVEPREAPVLELYPRDVQTVIVGGSADMQCRAIAGLPMPELHWSRQDGRPFPHNIEQLPGGLLRFTNITEHDGGSYICSASNEVGSTSTIATIEVHSMPVITITPMHGIMRVRLGDRVRLMCSASGHPQPNVAWSKHVNGMNVYDPYSRTAATPLSAVYEIFSVSPSDEGSYTCQATNAAGIADERIQIRIEDNEVEYPPCRGDEPCPPDHGQGGTGSGHGGVLIPEDFLRIPNGGKVEMRCKVFGPNDDQIYLDWRRSDHRSLPAGSTVHSGVLSIPVVDKTAAGEYICLGLDHTGSVLFRAKSHLEIISLPRIVLNPTRQTVGPGENPSIICTATGDEPLRVEWEAIGRPLPYSVSQNRGVLQFHGIQYSDAGKYVCKATNEAGTAEAVAEVIVNEHTYDETGVRATQRDVVTYAGNSVRLQCEVKEHAAIYWTRDGQPLPPNTRVGDNYIELSKVRPEDSGRYICEIQNSRGVSSDYINLNVHPATSVPAVSVEVSQDPVNIGDTIDIRCACTGARNPHYRWSRPNHASLPSNAMEFGHVLRLTRVTVADSGTYRCTAHTPEGSFDEDFNLVVHGGHNDAPAIETKSVPYGTSLEMQCRVDFERPTNFEWSKLGGLLPEKAETHRDKLKLIDVKAEDAGTYVCTASNGHSSIEVPTVLVVTGVVPNFSQAPQSYIALRPLPDSYLKFNIEVSFKPESYDGIILYNGETSRGTGDFTSLSLVGGYPQFRFELGSGPAIIRGDKPVTLSEWHTIKLQRNRKEGTMLVDGEGPYRNITVGRRQGLDLKEPLYVGGVPDYNMVYNQVDSVTGFVGCISRLVIGEKEVDLIADQTDSVGITDCETCAENPCNNGGVCQEASAKNGYRCLCRAGYVGKHCDYVGQSCYPGVCGEGTCVDTETSFTCYCPVGKTGQRCEHSKAIYDPAFQGDKAYVAHETPNALRRERKSSTTTHSQLRSRNAQVRNLRSRPHHHNNLHHTKKH